MGSTMDLESRCLSSEGLHKYAKRVDGAIGDKIVETIVVLRREVSELVF
jgi:hypothetical protein